jgi:DNA-binding HxlR family transcriptional regulator
MDKASSGPETHQCVVPERMAAIFALLQEKWTFAIVYALFAGPNGFNDLARGAGSVNSATLAQRLARLERAGLVTKTVHSTMPPRTSYELTEAGLALRPLYEELRRWTDRFGDSVAAEPERGS